MYIIRVAYLTKIGARKKGKKINANSLIQIKVKNDTTNTNGF